MAYEAEHYATIFRNRARVDFAGALQAAVVAQAAGLDEMVRTIGKTFSSIQRLEPGRFQQAHQQVGDAAVRAMVAGFNSRRFRRPAGRYRAGDNRLTGTLGRALNSTSMVRADATSLSIINEEVLDKEAAHWRRLNFGAGAGSTEGIIAPQKFTITWGGIVAGTLGLEMQPSPAFSIPFGFWISGGRPVPPSREALGTGQFFVGSPRGVDPDEPGFVPRQRKLPTAGIGSRNFLDAGVRAVANQLPRAYEQIYIDLWNTSRSTLDNAARYASAKVVGPTTQNISLHQRRSNRGNA